MKNTIINVIIEVSKDSNLKYEYNTRFNIEKNLILDRVLPYKFKYPFNYGFIPNTVSGDGQELDVILLLDEPLMPGTVISCKIIGGFEYKDEKGNDFKLIVSPANDVDPRFSNINNITNLKNETIEKIRYFFQHYKDNLQIKTYVGKIIDSHKATRIYYESKI